MVTLTRVAGVWDENGSPITAQSTNWQAENPNGSWGNLVGLGTSFNTDAVPETHGRRVRVEERRTNAYGETIASSEPYGPVVAPDPDPDPEPPSVVSAPELSGIPQVGETVTSTNGLFASEIPIIETQVEFQSSADGGTTWQTLP